MSIEGTHRENQQDKERHESVENCGVVHRMDVFAWYFLEGFLGGNGSPRRTFDDVEGQSSEGEPRGP